MSNVITFPIRSVCPVCSSDTFDPQLAVMTLIVMIKAEGFSIDELRDEALCDKHRADFDGMLAMYREEVAALDEVRDNVERIRDE